MRSKAVTLYKWYRAMPENITSTQSWNPARMYWTALVVSSPRWEIVEAITMNTRQVSKLTSVFLLNTAMSGLWNTCKRMREKKVHGGVQVRVSTYEHGALPPSSKCERFRFSTADFPIVRPARTEPAMAST